MKVIFTQSVPGVARQGEVRNVKPGYFRNFLMPRELAIHATTRLISEWESKRKQMVIDKEQLREQFKEISKRLSEKPVLLEKKVTSKGTLYGGVKTSDVAKAVKEQLNIDLPEESIVISEPIKTVGTHKLLVHLEHKVEAKMQLKVVEKKA